MKNNFSELLISNASSKFLGNEKIEQKIFKNFLNLQITFAYIQGKINARITFFCIKWYNTP